MGGGGGNSRNLRTHNPVVFSVSNLSISLVLVGRPNNN